MSRQSQKQDERPLAEVKSIADHPKFALEMPYITVFGRGKKSQVWKGNVDGKKGMTVNLNVFLDLSFPNKAKAREWAKWYAEENKLLFVESKGRGNIKF